MKAYFARPISQYNTPKDARDLALVKRLFDEIVDPNTPEFQAAYKVLGMKVFIDAVKECDAIIFRSFANGIIPAGVAKEVQAAYDADLIVLEIPSYIEGRTLSVLDTRAYLIELSKGSNKED